MLRFHDAATLKGRYAWLSMVTGISERHLRNRDARPRSSTLARVEVHAEKFASVHLAKRGFSETERRDLIDRHPRSLAAGVVYNTEGADGFEYPVTKAFAARIDALGADINEAQTRNELECAKKLLVETDWLNRRYFARTVTERSSGVAPGMLAKIGGAKTWDDLRQPRAVVTANLLFSMLALWDIELHSKHFRRLQARSILSLLLPLNASSGARVRGMLHLPVRRLLELVYSLAERSCRGAWPKTRPSVTLLSTKTNESEQSVVNWRDGTKRFGWRDFERVWNAIFAATLRGESQAPSPLAPLFVAATIFQDLFVKIDSSSQAKEVWLVDGEYADWWSFHAENFEGAKAEENDASPWPAWLIRA
ncbi:MAG: hypothetical protein M9885_10700 [Burkholderiaceae bacterium]|nr:hypothetical protein [Burkholderiaceae bacterium]